VTLQRQQLARIRSDAPQAAMRGRTAHDASELRLHDCEE